MPILQQLLGNSACKAPKILMFRQLACKVLKVRATPSYCVLSKGRVQMTQSDIVLNDLEKEIVDTLMAAREHHGLNTTVRCAGGWVRDKLLGRESKDIDIALDDLSGKDFAEKVRSFQEATGKEMSGMGVIAANPDQSKHLETATLRLHGLSIDMVHLRSEKYTEESRIPTIEVGTPQEDAERRDFTINSLFYNVNLRKVEDLTGRGLEDLKNGIIRTPLDPLVTFMDDPLRVLRAVRFASRYSFTLVDELQAAAASEEVVKALEHKIARERMGAELAGCFDGPHPLQAIAYLDHMRAFPVVFQLPEAMQAQVGPDYGARCVRCLELATGLLSRDADVWLGHRRVACLSALLLPLRLLSVKKKKRIVPVTAHVIGDSLKLPNKDFEQAVLLQRSLPELCRIHDDVQGMTEEQLMDINHTFSLRADLGACLASLKALERTALVLFPLLYHKESEPLVDAREASDASLYSPSLSEVSDGDMLACTGRLQRVAQAWDLLGCYSWPALIDGKQIVSALELGKPGPIVGKLTTLARQWQYAHAEWHPAGGATGSSNGSPPPDLIAFLKEEKAKME